MSDELTHFVGCAESDDESRYALTLTVLRSGHLKRGADAPFGEPGFEGVVSYRYSSTEPFSRAPHDIDCVCFCDIPAPDLPFHMKRYGPFGIAFTKAFLLTKGACPVYYWAGDALHEGATRREYLDKMVENVHLLDGFARAGRPHPSGKDWSELQGRLHLLRGFIHQNVLCFIKQFDGALPDDDDANFYMEREWRVAHSLTFALAHVRRIIITAAFAERFRRDIPEYCGQLQFAD